MGIINNCAVFFFGTESGKRNNLDEATAK